MFFEKKKKEDKDLSIKQLLYENKEDFENKKENAFYITKKYEDSKKMLKELINPSNFLSIYFKENLNFYLETILDILEKTDEKILKQFNIKDYYDLINLFLVKYTDMPFFQKKFYKEIKKDDFSEILIFSNNVFKTQEIISKFFTNKILKKEEKVIIVRDIYKEFMSVLELQNTVNTLIIFDIYNIWDFQKDFISDKNSLIQKKPMVYIKYSLILFLTVLYLTNIRFCPVLLTFNNENEFYSEEQNLCLYYSDFYYKNNIFLFNDLFNVIINNKPIKKQIKEIGVKNEKETR